MTDRVVTCPNQHYYIDGEGDEKLDQGPCGQEISGDEAFFTQPVVCPKCGWTF